MSAIASSTAQPAPGSVRDRGAPHRARGPLAREPLGTYVAADGERRQVVCRRGAGGSALVIDQRTDAGDRRLVAHLAADEPPDNAALVCELYLADPEGRRARALSDLDWFWIPGTPASAGGEPPDELTDRHGRRYRLELVAARGGEARQLRWTRRAGAPTRRAPVVVSLRTVTGALEANEPARTMSHRALTRHVGSGHVLRSELAKLGRSPYVLNRALREAVQRAIADGERLSAIAARCGRLHSGNTGDTSWLERRIGLKGEANGRRPTPWVHADVLARIARDGLGIDPRDVELA